MPELPEVEATRRYLLSQGLEGRGITGVTLSWPRVVRGVPPDLLEPAIRHRRIGPVGRRAKLILLPLVATPATAAEGPLALVLHLGMTGSLVVLDGGEEPSAHAHTVFRLDDGRELRFRDSRKFGKVWLVQDEAELLRGLGPEPLDAAFTPRVLRELLRGRAVPVKALLCDQSVIAGVGNIYADEALFLARVHPLRRAADLSAAEAKRLHQGIVTTLSQALEKTTKVASRGGLWVEGVDDYDRLHVPRSEGSPCERCGKSIARLVIRGRGAYYCGRCQRMA